MTSTAASRRRARKSNWLASCSLVLLVMGCLGLLVASAGFYYLPVMAANLFGPADPALSAFQRIYLSGSLLLRQNDLTLPNDLYGEPRIFDVELGESPVSIASRLEREEIIASSDLFLDYLIYAGLDTTLQAGTYHLSPQMTPLEIAASLQDATPKEVDFTILPGWRLEEVAAAIPTSGLRFSPEAFFLASDSIPDPYNSFINAPPGAGLEGFLLPGTYRVPRDLQLQDFITTVLDNFQTKIDREMLSGFERQGLTLFEAVTLASIVEREAVVDEEMSLIASVFVNRLAVGMRLETDPTVQYALGYDETRQTWWTNPLSLQDLKVDSPYNTYLYAGLPPGPIANPSLEALRAVAFPAQTPYYFFRSECNGSGRHVFSETFEEHLNNACK